MNNFDIAVCCSTAEQKAEAIILGSKSLNLDVPKEDIQLIPAASQINEQPIGRDEIMTGTLNRVHNGFESWVDNKFPKNQSYLGLFLEAARKTLSFDNDKSAFLFGMESGLIAFLGN